MRSIAGQRGAAATLALAVAGALGCWGPETPAPADPAAKKAEQVDVAPLGREIFALALDNKDRCLRVAREALRIYELHKSPVDFQPIRKFITHDAKPEEAAIHEASDIAFRLLNRVQKTADEEATAIAKSLDQLLRAQGKLCQQAYTVPGFKSNYDQRISLAMLDLVKQEQAVRRHVMLTDTERRAIRERYRPQLAAARQAVLDEYAALGEAAQWKFGDDLADQAPADAREREESWRRQQAWLEEQRRQQDALHREAVEQFRGREPRAEEESTRRLGLVPTTEVGPDGGPPPSAMKGWHADYSLRALPAKIALDRVLQVREDVTLPRAERACQSLFGKASDLLMHAGTFDSPDGEAGRHLKEAFTLFRQAAEACMRGEQAETGRLLDEGRAALDRAATILRQYDLAP